MARFPPASAPAGTMTLCPRVASIRRARAALPGPAPGTACCSGLRPGAGSACGRTCGARGPGTSSRRPVGGTAVGKAGWSACGAGGCSAEPAGWCCSGSGAGPAPRLGSASGLAGGPSSETGGRPTGGTAWRSAWAAGRATRHGCRLAAPAGPAELPPALPGRQRPLGRPLTAGRPRICAAPGQMAPRRVLPSGARCVRPRARSAPARSAPAHRRPRPYLRARCAAPLGAVLRARSAWRDVSSGQRHGDARRMTARQDGLRGLGVGAESRVGAGAPEGRPALVTLCPGMCVGIRGSAPFCRVMC